MRLMVGPAQIVRASLRASLRAPVPSIQTSAWKLSPSIGFSRPFSRSVVAGKHDRMGGLPLRSPLGSSLGGRLGIRSHGLSLGLPLGSPMGMLRHSSTTSTASSPGLETVPQVPKFSKPRVISTTSVAWWLAIAAALVFGIVLLGGLTRLTESGLSITEWKPVTGSLPPVTEENWQQEFEKYKQSPEFQQLNSNITLDEYKFIYYMEWGHRLWGRTIGLFIVLPAAYFVLKRRTSPATNRALLWITGLIGFQGFLGWWMVKSGLDQDNLDSRHNTQPRVSQYRLAAHLGAAFVVYFTMLGTSLSIFKENRFVRNPVEAVKTMTLLSTDVVKPFRRFSKFVFAFTFLTAMSGAFVAGLDAGLLYNSFPYMGERIIPAKSELFDEMYVTRSGNEPTTYNVVKTNMLENPVTVQLNHRVLAVTTWCLSVALFLYARKIRPVLPKNVYRAAHGVIGLATLQASLGICTLIYVVPIPLASAHQAGALALLTQLLVLLVRLRLPRPQIRRLIELMAQKATAASNASQQAATTAAANGQKAAAAQAAVRATLKK